MVRPQNPPIVDARDLPCVPQMAQPPPASIVVEPHTVLKFSIGNFRSGLYGEGSPLGPFVTIMLC